MSYTVAQIQAQNAEFKKALDSKAITQAQYDQAMAYQSISMAKAAQVQATPVAQTPYQTSTPHVYEPSPVTPVADTSLPFHQYNSSPYLVPGEETKLYEEPAAPPEPVNLVAPTLENIITNPGGVIGTVANLLGIASEKLPEGPVKTLVDLEVGAGGNMANQYTQAQNIMGSVAGVKSNPVSFAPQNPMQKTGMTANVIAEAAAVAIAAPVIGPALGVGASSVLIGEGLGVGINQGFKAIQGGGLLTPEEVAMSAAEGGVFSIVGGALIGKVASTVPRLVGEVANPFVRAATRIGINTGLGAGSSAILSGGNPDAIIQGAAFGAGFGFAGEVAGAIAPKIPVLKYGDVKVPYEGTFENEVYSGEANWKGLYLSKNAEARLIVGKLSNLPDEGVRVKGIVGETPSFRPQSNIEAELTRKVMLETGTPKEVIDINRKAVDVTQIAKGVKNPKLFEDFLPKETKTSSIEEVTQLKDYVIQNKNVVEKVFGKFSAIPQESKSFSYETLNSKGEIVSSARTTTDIDIQLKSGLKPEQVQQFAKDVFDIYNKNPATMAKMEVGKTLIETRPVELRGTTETKLAHAVDIHSDFDVEMNPTGITQSSKGKAWGIKIAENPKLIEKVPTASLKEQVAGKLQSIMDITEEGEFGPVSHRAKDIPDFLHDARTLIEQRSNPTVKTKGMSELQDIADYFKVGNIKDIKPETETYFISKPASVSRSSLVIVPAIVSSNVNVSSSTSKASKNYVKTASFNSPISLPSTSSYSKATKASTDNFPSLPSIKPSVTPTSFASVSNSFPSLTSLTSSKASKSKPTINIENIPSFSSKIATSKLPIRISSIPIFTSKMPVIKRTPKTQYYTGEKTPTLTPKLPSPFAPYKEPYSRTNPKNPMLPTFSFGGGGGESRVGSARGFNKFQKTHKIKTFSQMLNTFGLGAAAKPMRGIEKATNRLIKQTKRRKR